MYIRILSSVLLVLAIYLTGAFIAGTFNTHEWLDCGRFFVASFAWFSVAGFNASYKH